MSMTFTKLFSSITESTIWCEDSDTRVVWITFLAMADRNGRVFGSIPGIANRARVPVKVARKAVARFLAPDPDSRSNTYDPAAEGRRIEVIEGGWRVINHAYYRAIRDEEERRAYKAEHERKRRAAKRGQNGQTCTPVDSAGHNAEADTDAEADKSKTSIDVSGATQKVFLEVGLAGNEARMLVHDAVQAYVHTNNSTYEAAADGLIDLWKSYEAAEIKYKKGVFKFFKEGLWKGTWKGGKEWSPEDFERRMAAEKAVAR